MSGMGQSNNNSSQGKGKRKFPLWGWVLIALAIAGIIAIIICIILRNRSNHKEGFTRISDNSTLDIAPETSYLESYISTSLGYTDNPIVQVTTNGYATE